jgi:hypothetical protein
MKFFKNFNEFLKQNKKVVVLFSIGELILIYVFLPVVFVIARQFTTISPYVITFEKGGGHLRSFSEPFVCEYGGFMSHYYIFYCNFLDFLGVLYEKFLLSFEPLGSVLYLAAVLDGYPKTLILIPIIIFFWFLGLVLLMYLKKKKQKN